MNFLLAFLIFTALFLFGVKPIGINDKIKTNTPLQLIPSYEQALQSGILQIKEGIILSPIP